MHKLIVNADDFALTNACSRGIVELFELGALTSTTILATGEDFEQSVKLARQSGINIGLHLCLTYGRPVAPLEQINSLVDANGVFKYIDVLQNEQVDVQEVETEWRAQITKLREAGIQPDHLDSHHFVHEVLGGEVLALAVRLAKELGLPMRQGPNSNKHYYNEKGIKTPDVFCRDFYGEGVSVEQLKEILSRPWEGTMELMCHPGHVDERIEAISSYTKGRQKEFEVLSSPEICEHIKKEGIQLISFADL